MRIVDSQNRLLAVFNLFEFSLDFPENRQTLKQLFLQAATKQDSDRDELPDDWEQIHFGNLAAAAQEDSDGDGQSNFTEFAFGTKPNDAKSVFHPALQFMTSGSEKTFAMQFQRRAGSMLNFIVETSSDLKNWSSSSSDLAEITPHRLRYDGSGTLETGFNLTRTLAAQPNGFIRVRALPRLATP
ncbi:MAG: hypothetical protein AB1813_17190 [Verrucomicrobiota bacterium]